MADDLGAYQVFGLAIGEHAVGQADLGKRAIDPT